MSGLFISLEGGEGSGKSTIVERLARAFLEAGCLVTVTREPGGSTVGEWIRELLLSSDAHDLTAATEALLFTAARAQHVSTVIVPALERGEIVICDRFTDSTLAYQWGGRGLPFELLVSAQRLATGTLEPDLKLLLDVPVVMGLKRRLSANHGVNRLDRESIQFHDRVRDAYLVLAFADPDHWQIIDASQSEEAVWGDVQAAVARVDHGCQSAFPGSDDFRPECLS